MVYTTTRSEVYNGEMVTIFCSDGCEAGRVIPVGQFFQGKHSCRHNGGVFKTEQEAIEYVIGVDLMIDAKFAGKLRVSELEVAA